MDLMEQVGLLQRTRWPTVVAAASTAHWMFGNLYEEVVTMPPALVHPQPGALVEPLGLGSPLWYYGPTLPVAVAASWMVAHRLGAAPTPGRRVRRAAWAITAAAALKAMLITTVNPGFRDSSVSPDAVRGRAVLWLVGNGAVVLGLGAGLVGLLAWRRVPVRHPHPTSSAHASSRPSVTS